MFVSKKRFEELEKDSEQLKAAVYNLQNLTHMHDRRLASLLQDKDATGEYDGEIRIKTRIDQSAVKKFSKRVSKINKKLKKTIRLMKKAGKQREKPTQQQLN